MLRAPMCRYACRCASASCRRRGCVWSVRRSAPRRRRSRTIRARAARPCASPNAPGPELARINLILLALLTACALGLVTSQHKARKLFGELEREQEQAKQLDVEWGQLQLEQRTWAMHARVEKIARDRLHMRVPEAARTQVVLPATAAAGR